MSDKATTPTASTALLAGLSTIAAGALMLFLTTGTMADIKAGAQGKMNAALAARAASSEDSISDVQTSMSNKHHVTADGHIVDDDGNVIDDATDDSNNDATGADAHSASNADKSGVDSNTSVDVVDGYGGEHSDAFAEGVIRYAKDSVYDIEWGDTLSQISRDTGISVDALANYNDIRNVDLIYAGSSLRVPAVE